MTRSARIWVAMTLALTVLVVLLSPTVAGPLTTLRYKHNIRLGLSPLLTAIPVPVTLDAFAARDAWALREAVLATRGPDLLDLTGARLC